MLRGRLHLTAGACLLVISACSASVESGGSGTDAGPTTQSSPETTLDATTTEPTAPADSTTTEPPPPSTEATTTTTEPELQVYDADCVVVVEPGNSLGLIADRFDDDTVTVASIRAENGISGDTIYPGQLLDVCVDNGLDDITGEERPERNAALADAETRANVEIQQTKLNQLFAGYGINELLVDGVSGPVTRQRLCAARLALGLPVSATDMEQGSEEEQLLMATDTLPLPYTTALLSERWVLIDQTCQIMFVGRGAEEIVFVFPTSTGEPGHETRPQDRSRVFRFDPALQNNGWHNSTDFPAANDNPLNGNLYKPLYFDGGQAIHGANNVPTSPQSKGCARLRVEHQDLLVSWLGLADASGPTNDSGRINLRVNVQGAYVPTS
jgi:LysM repeat protein